MAYDTRICSVCGQRHILCAPQSFQGSVSSFTGAQWEPPNSGMLAQVNNQHFVCAPLLLSVCFNRAPGLLALDATVLAQTSAKRRAVCTSGLISHYQRAYACAAPCSSVARHPFGAPQGCAAPCQVVCRGRGERAGCALPQNKLHLYHTYHLGGSASATGWLWQPVRDRLPAGMRTPCNTQLHTILYPYLLAQLLITCSGVTQQCLHALAPLLGFVPVQPFDERLPA